MHVFHAAHIYFSQASITPFAWVTMPAGPSPARELFEKLADDFRFDRLVVDHILDLKLESLSDFRHYVTEESELEKAPIHWRSCQLASAWSRPLRHGVTSFPGTVSASQSLPTSCGLTLFSRFRAVGASQVCQQALVLWELAWALAHRRVRQPHRVLYMTRSARPYPMHSR